jgi:hypothetical protein
MISPLGTDVAWLYEVDPPETSVSSSGVNSRAMDRANTLLLSCSGMLFDSFV